MRKQVKEMPGELFDLKNKKLLGKGHVIITRYQQSPPNPPVYVTTITVKGLRLDLDRITCFLQLGQDMGSEVFLSLPPSSPEHETPLANDQITFRVAFQSWEWLRSDWFESLR